MEIDMRYFPKYFPGPPSIFQIANRVQAEFIAIVSEDKIVIDKYHRSICDFSGNRSIENSEESVQKLVGCEVYYVTSIPGENELGHIDIFVNRELVTEKLEDLGKYIGTGGGLQAVTWAKNKRILIKTVNKYLPEKDRIKSFRTWSGLDFSDFVEVRV